MPRSGSTPTVRRGPGARSAARSEATRRHLDANRAHWDDAARLHPDTDFYAKQLALIRAGGTTLHEFELESVGDVRGRSLLHLQSHIGTETLSWAAQGAQVTAVDFSAEALRRLRSYAAELGLTVRCIESALHELPQRLDESFDVVYTSWGVLGWQPDLWEWAEVAARYVRQGGLLYIAELHPVMWLLDEDAPGPVLKYSYFQEAPFIDESQGSYADREAVLEHPLRYGWEVPLGDVVTALVDA
ncbi:MAG TPA: methyltransferase domain-containing protein, partial [Candidatus Dormibacteraeota bacterium]|nr:methyltransferase domain-containing protein [Candidatus Dormibacteraeota bacterium]